MSKVSASSKLAKGNTTPRGIGFNKLPKIPVPISGGSLITIQIPRNNQIQANIFSSIALNMRKRGLKLILNKKGSANIPDTALKNMTILAVGASPGNK